MYPTNKTYLNGLADGFVTAATMAYLLYELYMFEDASQGSWFSIEDDMDEQDEKRPPSPDEF